MPRRAQLGEASELAHGRTYARRQALGRILRPRAQSIQDNTVGHALRATNYLGLGEAAAKRYGAISARAIPGFVNALEADDAERVRILAVVNVYIRELAAAGFRHFAVKPLASLGFRLALKEVNAHAAEEGFEAEDLEDELRVFQRAFEARILYRS